MVLNLIMSMTFKKRIRHIRYLVEGVYHTPMSYRTDSTLATSHVTSIVHDDVVVGEDSLHEGSLDRRATPVAFGVSVKDHANLITRGIVSTKLWPVL